MYYAFLLLNCSGTEVIADEMCVLIGMRIIRNDVDQRRDERTNLSFEMWGFYTCFIRILIM